MKKIMVVGLIFTLFTIYTSVFTNVTETNALTTQTETLNLNESNNIIKTKVSETVDISTITFTNYYGRVSLADGVISNVSSNVDYTGTTLFMSEPGSGHFDFSYGGYTNLVYVLSTEADSDTYSLVNDDFNTTANASIPADLELIAGSAGVMNQRLEMDSRTETAKVQFRDIVSMMSDYTIQMDFSFKEVNSSSRWVSVVFRGEDFNFYQLTLRQGATSLNGVELSKSTNGSISSLEAVQLPSDFVLNQTYQLRLEVLGSQIKVYIDDELLLENSELNDYNDGFVGIQSNGNIVTIDNVSLIYQDNQNEGSHNFMSVPRLYTVESNANREPSIIKYVNSNDDINELFGLIRPHISIFKLNEELMVINDKNEVLMTLKEALLAADGLVIPGFEISSEASALALSNALKEYQIVDSFIVSSNDVWIKAAHDNYPLIKGALLVGYDDQKSELDNDDLISIKERANVSYSNVVILPYEYVSQSTTFFFQKHLLTTWAADGDSTIGTTSKVIFAGTDGVITNETYNVVSILQGLPENSILKRPIIIGHRGMSTKGPENTVESSQLAIDSGADAVELDIRLTLDDQIIVMHDANTSRTTGVSLNIGSTNYDELTALSTLGYPELGDIKVPGLEDYFIAFEEEEVMLLIEIKDDDILIVQKLKELIEQYPKMKDQIIVISFNKSQLEEMRVLLPEQTTAYLNGETVTGNVTASVENNLRLYVPLGSASDLYFGSVSHEYITEFNHRGIQTIIWTLNSAEALYDNYLENSLGFTTDYTYLFKDTWNQYVVNDTNYELTINTDEAQDSFTVGGLFKTPGGTEYPSKPTVIILDPDKTNLTLNEQNIITGADKEGRVFIKTQFESTLPNGETFVVFGDVIEVTVLDASNNLPVCNDNETLVDNECVSREIDTEEPGVEEEPTNYTNYIIGGVSAVVAVGAAVVVGKKIKK